VILWMWNSRIIYKMEKKSLWIQMILWQ
jgi:hypothetical protein